MFLVSSKIFNSIHIHSFHFRQPNPTQPILRNISIRKNEERERGGGATVGLITGIGKRMGGWDSREGRGGEGELLLVVVGWWCWWWLGGRRRKRKRSRRGMWGNRVIPRAWEESGMNVVVTPHPHSPPRACTPPTPKLTNNHPPV